jgi:hypothetical protein
MRLQQGEPKLMLPDNAMHLTAKPGDLGRK